ncbi:MAG TPA: thaumatin family protein [Kofleriaceae bacterium]|nr:thaumatin family protein [Kofleriaceae bacterium]
MQRASSILWSILALRRPRRALLTIALAIGAWGLPRPAAATSFTVKNNCSYTVYPGVFPASVFSNGGWTLAPGASSTFTVPSGSIGRLWGRTGCNTATSPAQCTTGSCGGTGLQCAGTTGQPNTSLFEWNINASGTDWYDVSYVDAVDNPIGVNVTNGSCVSPASCSASVLTSCPTELKSGNVCLSPCTRFNTDQFCCRGAFGTPQTCVVANWTATAQTYVNNIHALCPREYSYAYDENSGGALQTCPTGSSFTITFCPGGSAPPAANVALGKATASSSNESSAFTPNLAVDGNGGTRWSSAFSDPQWIRVDLGATHTINRIVLRWEAAFARAYQIQTSPDGNTWTTIHSTTSGAGGVEDFAVTGSGRFVRMNGTARATQWGYSLWEFEVYGTRQ